MKKILSFVAFAASLSLVTAASAESRFNYNHADISYEHAFYDERGIDDGKGVNVAGTFSPVENIFLQLDYDYSHTNAFGLGVDFQAYTYGVGGYYSVDERVDLVASVAGTHQRVRVEDLGTDTDNGYLLSLGARTLPFCTL